MATARIDLAFMFCSVPTDVMRRLLLLLAFLTAGRAFAEDALRPPPRLHFGGFADGIARDESTNVVALDLFSTLRMSNSWTGLVEVVGQKTWRSGENSPEQSEVGLERLYVSYRPSDYFRLEIGETHTGIVRWNEREHRSRFLQTPIDVPAIARRPQDDGAWPLRFVGVWASGRARGSLGLTYEIGAGAGPGTERDEIPIFSSSRSPAGFVAMSIAPENFPGFETGVSVYGQHVPTKPNALRERDVTVFMNYVNRGLEVRAELARMEHDFTRIPTTFRNEGYYVLLSKRLGGVAQRARPYVLFDHVNIDAADTYLRNSASENAWAAGIRYDFTEHFVVKSEYRSQRARDGSRQPITSVQLSVSF